MPYKFNTLPTAHSTPNAGLALQSIKSKYLIIQNKGGGHGTIGYQLCKSIIQKNNNNNNIDITLIQDKCNYKTSPFQY
jgi:hypothetical protein